MSLTEIEALIPGVYIVGAGPGDPDLLTVKAHKLLAAADVILFADSLVPKQILHGVRADAEAIQTADKTLEEIVPLMVERVRAGKSVVRLHSGDPCLYGAVGEQMQALASEGIAFEVIPGISAFQLAAAKLKIELTVPGIVQTIILTRISGRTKVPEREELASLAAHQASLCLYLSARHVEQAKLMEHYPSDLPVAICYRLGWPDEKIVLVPLDKMAVATRENNLIRTTMYVISPALGKSAEGRSRLYHPEHDRLFRQLAVGSWQLQCPVPYAPFPMPHSPFPIPHSPFPMKDLTRRQFITVTALSAGFALAVHPIAAAVINTDAAGLIAGEVKIPVKDGQIPAYRAMPASGSNFPVILVIQEIFGVHAHIQDICRRFAKLGYLAIAPEMFASEGDFSKITDIHEIISKVVSKVPDAQVMSDLDATVEWAQKSGKGNINKLGITGFCWGGRIVWLYSSHNPKVKAGVAWYGRLVADSTALTPKQPIDLAATLKVPVLGLYGGKDDSIPQDTVEKMREVLKTGSSGSEIVLYPDAPHGFNADYRPTYREKEAKDAWKRLQEWFKKHGVS